MPQPWCIRLLPLIALTAFVGACERTATEPQTEPAHEDPRSEQISAAEPDLTFVRFAPDAPALADTVVSFWAVKGEQRSVKIEYVETPGYENGGTCLEFVVPADALLRHPDGRTAQAGDSVRITIRVVDTRYFKFQFEPAGLQFDPARPAELRVFYDWRDHDHSEDGVLNEQDAEIEQRFAFWRQDRPAEPWMRQSTARDDVYEKAVTAVTSFTRYALASN